MASHDPEGPAEDVLGFGNRPRIPRWAFAVGGLLVAVLITGAVVALRVGSPGTPAPSTSALPPSNVAAANDAGGAADADDVLVLGSYLFRLAPDALSRSDPAGAVTTLPIGGLDALGRAGSYHLVGDAAAHLVWLVAYGGSPTTLLAVGTDTMAVRARVTWPQTVNAAAALNGDLYIVTANAVVDVSLDRPPVDVARLTGRYLSIAADEARYRLVLFDAASLHAVNYDPTTRAVRSGPKLPFGKGDVLVDGDGDLWAGGYRFTAGGGAVLVRLDPRTLRPVASSPLAGQLGPGALLVASGTSVIWVRSGAGGDELWCLDGRTGRVAQHWHASGAVTSRTGNALVDVVGKVKPLTLHGCRG
ncbi:MAG TPA: hypothetical protein VFT67_09660 [Jatrophihabitantaceae bacterium]|nr:hypothetical protein [Jatrophihabitantaceae bacterium]